MKKGGRPIAAPLASAKMSARRFFTQVLSSASVLPDRLNKEVLNKRAFSALRTGGIGNDSPYSFTAFNGALYFNASNPGGHQKLYKTDGTGVIQVSNTSGSAAQDDYPFDLQVVGNALYFTAFNAGGFQKLYKTDGQTITQLTDINPGDHDFDSYVGQFNANGVVLIDFGGALYLNAYSDYAGGIEKTFRLRAQ